MQKENPTPKPRRRMSLQKKLWLAGLGFPTVLLILLAIYITQRAPTLRMLEWLESQTAPIQTSTPGTSMTMSKGSVTTRLWWPLDEESKTRPLPMLYRYFGSVKEVFVMNEQLPAEQLALILSQTGLESLWIMSRHGFGAADLAPIVHLKNLRHLSLQFIPSDITDETLEWISRLDRLETLSLPASAAVTEAGLNRLQRLPNLKSINLDIRATIIHPGLFYSRFPAMQSFNLSLREDCRECISAIVARKSIDRVFLAAPGGFSDDSLELLLGLESVTEITILGHASEEAMTKLQVRFPTAMIDHITTRNRIRQP